MYEHTNGTNKKVKHRPAIIIDLECLLCLVVIGSVDYSVRSVTYVCVCVCVCDSLAEHRGCKARRALYKKEGMIVVGVQ